MGLDARSPPPQAMRLLFKQWQKSTVENINKSTQVLDFSRRDLTQDDRVDESHIRCNYTKSPFVGESAVSANDECVPEDIVRYEIKALPGLFVYPALLSENLQSELLNALLHRDLSNDVHNTNLHLHYHIPYPDPGRSFFHESKDVRLIPKDSTIHRPLTIQQMLSRKLRWMTLGGQYDWTEKVYPAEQPPAFPSDVSDLLRSVWPDVDAQAAIVNFYTPGDTLSVHRDVSEECDRGLISISIGCDGIFIIGNEDASVAATIRLKSGDAVLMSGTSRFAWHAVPRILPATCPDTLCQWPAEASNSDYASWKGWLADKRINLNVRQMRDESTIL